MIIKIHKDEVIKAKRDIKLFDEQKTYNKFNCSYNYIGLLGEMVLHRYLKENNIEHEWIEFIKKGVCQPDFIINGRTVDLKTSRTNALYVQERNPHDIYLAAQIDKDDSVLVVHGWILNKQINKVRKKVDFGSRNGYVIAKKDINLMVWLTGVIPSSSVSLTK